MYIGIYRLFWSVLVGNFNPFLPEKMCTCRKASNRLGLKAKPTLDRLGLKAKHLWSLDPSHARFEGQACSWQARLGETPVRSDRIDLSANPDPGWLG